MALLRQPKILGKKSRPIYVEKMWKEKLENTHYVEKLNVLKLCKYITFFGKTFMFPETTF